MKKQIAILAALTVAGGLSAFGQGYVNFTTGAGYVYDEFTTPGSDVVSAGTASVAFLWAATGTSDPLGAGIPTTGANSAAGSIGTIEQMLSSGGWTLAENYNAGASPTEVDGTIGSTGFGKGAISYNGGSNFQLAGTTAGDTYQVIVLGWNVGAGATLADAENNATALGWSSALDYATGASSSSPVSSFSSQGLSKFGVAPVPEPATLALAGLGGLSMLFLRRRKA